MKSRQKAFTLVEVLIVITIIGILAGLFILVAGPGIARSKTTPTCASNLRQIAAGYSMYMLDNDDAFPVRSSLTNDTYAGKNYVAAAIKNCPLTHTGYWDNVGEEIGYKHAAQPPMNTVLGDGRPIPSFDPELDVLYRCLDHAYNGYYRGGEPGKGRFMDGCSSFGGRVLGVRLSGTVAKVNPYSCWEFSRLPTWVSPDCPSHPQGFGCDYPSTD